MRKFLSFFLLSFLWAASASAQQGNADTLGQLTGTPGSFIAIAVDASCNFTVKNSIAPAASSAVPIITNISGSGVALVFTGDINNNFSTAIVNSIPTGSSYVPVIGYASGAVSSISIATGPGTVTAGSCSTSLANLSVYTGPIATGTMISEDKLTFGATSQMEACSRHIARTNITNMSVDIPTWYVNHADGAENALGGTATVNLVIEYPVGTVAGTFTWSGQSTATLPNNSNNFSDTLNITIPNGGVFMLHIFWSGANGYVVNNGNDIASPIIKNFARDVNNGEKYRAAASGLTMQATCSAITSSETNGQNGFRPAAIVGSTSQPTVFLLGDSRMMGFHDHFDNTSTDTGYARAYGPNFAYINAGIFAETTGQYIASHTLKNQLAAYCSHIIFELGFNDITNVGSSLTTLAANQQTIFGYFPGKPIFVQTVPPGTTSTDAWLTSGNQTPLSKQANIAVYNNSVRGGTIAGQTGFFEFATIAEGTQDSGLWNPTTTPISAIFTGQKTTTTMTVSAMTSGAIAVLDQINGVGVSTGDQVAAFGTGVGQTGDYTNTKSQSVGPITMFSNAPTTDGVHEMSKMYGLYVTGNAVNPALIHR